MHLSVKYPSKVESPKDIKVIEAAAAIVAKMLPHCNETVRFERYQKARWSPKNGTFPVKVKLGAPPRAVIAVVRTPLGDNGDVWEYLLTPELETRGWLMREMQEFIDARNAEHLEAKREKQLPSEPQEVAKAAVVDPPSSPAPQRVSLSELFRAMEQVAERHQKRKGELDALRKDIAALRLVTQGLEEQLQQKKAALEEFELRELSLVEAIENDAECKAAQDALSVFERFASATQTETYSVR